MKTTMMSHLQEQAALDTNYTNAKVIIKLAGLEEMCDESVYHAVAEMAGGSLAKILTAVLDKTIDEGKNINWKSATLEAVAMLNLYQTLLGTFTHYIKRLETRPLLTISPREPEEPDNL